MQKKGMGKIVLQEDVATEIKVLRAALGLSQSKFAAALGVATRTVCHWEQGLRRPDGAVRKLLRILERHPELIDM